MLAPAQLGTIRDVRHRHRLHRLAVAAGLTVLLLLLFALAMSLGDYPVPPDAILRSLLSPWTGQADRGTDFIVLSVRLPRATLAVLTGAAFGLSGIIFQTILRNPLASPDIIGISSGSSAAAVFCIIVLHLSGAYTALGSLAGGILTAALIYALAWRNGVTAYRVVLIGIGMEAMLLAIVSYLFTRARLVEVQEALGWLVGSLNAATTTDIIPLSIAVAVMSILTALLVRTLDALQLGDDTARALGVRVELCRLGLILAGVGLVAFATAAVGPVTFVPFVAGPIARSLLGGSGRGFLPAALVGAIVMLGSDLVAQHALPTTQLPVGVVTGLFGAIFLIYLLVASNRAGSVN
jgi:iron complex transport system permease protein